MLSKSKLLLLVGVVLSIAACKDDSKDKASKQALPVNAIKVEAKNVPLSFEYPARAKGYKETEIRARVGGILLKRNYVEGSTVKEGDILFQIDPEQYKADLVQAKGRLAQGEAQLKAAKTQWTRIAKLFEDRIVSEKSRDDARANLDSLQATVEAARGELRTAELNLEYTTVTSPINGITSLESQSEGSLIVANSEASLLTTVTQVDPVYILFSISDNDIFKLRSLIDKKLMNDPKQKSVTAKIKLSDDTIYEHEGEINFINPTIDETTGTVMLRAVFPNPDANIMPKQFVRLILNGLSMENAITLPKEAVLQGAQGSFVYKINAKGLIEVTHVDTGFTAEDGQWIIEGGLKAGDVIASGSLMKIKAGMPVIPKFTTDTPTTPAVEAK